jgi:hypothetical protein
MAISEEQQATVSQPSSDNGGDVEAAYKGILEEARSWSEEWRFRLIHALLDTLAVERAMSAKQKAAAEKLVGFLAVEGKAPPTDKEVAQIIEEARMEKYG